MWSNIDGLIERDDFWDTSPWLDSLCHTFNEDHNYYRLLYHLVLEYKPKVTLEIGTWWGVGSAFMAVVANTYGGKVIGIDLHEHDLTKYILPDRYDYHFVQGNSLSDHVADEVDYIAGDNNIGLVFQDSSHHYDQSVREWEIYSQMLSPNAIWICDDITSDFEGMEQYFNELPGEKQLYKDALHYGNTMGIIQLP